MILHLFSFALAMLGNKMPTIKKATTASTTTSSGFVNAIWFNFFISSYEGSINRSPLCQGDELDGFHHSRPKNFIRSLVVLDMIIDQESQELCIFFEQGCS